MHTEQWGQLGWGEREPSAHCRGSMELGMCISPAHSFPPHPFPSPSPRPSPISPTYSQGGAWAPHKFGKDPGILLPCPGQHSPQGAGQPFPPANPCQKLTQQPPLRAPSEFSPVTYRKAG